MLRRRRTWTAIISAVLAIVLAGCGSGAGAPTQSAADDHLTIYNSYKVASLDPNESGTNWLFDWGIAENLLQVDESGEIQPWLAEKVERATDTTWNITLRSGLTFQNGTKLDAAAAAKALNRQVTGSKASQVYMDAKSVFTATGDLTLTLTTPQPNAMVPAALASRDNAFQIYDVSVVEAADGDSTKIAGKGAFTGPYAITSWTPENLEMTRYDGYWAGTPAMAAVTVKVVADEQARIAGVQSGQADLAFYPSPDAKLSLDGRTDAYFLQSELALQALLVDMNLTAAPFDDAAVRTAFLMSVDYAQLAEKVANGVFDTATGLYPASMSYAVANQKTDVEQAKTVLAAAGWTEGSDGIRTKNGTKLTVRFVTQAQGPETLALASAMQAQVKEAGFDLQINNAEDSAKVKADMSAWDSSIGLNGSLSGTADPIQPFLSRWTTGGSANAQGLSNAKVDAIGAKLQTTFDEGERDTLLKEAQNIIVTENAYVFAATYKRFLVVASPAWKDYTVSNVRAHLRWNTAP
ncbi:ABC transporter substrate-binding protein [Propionicicella superfundia]|uniref:ABC transporter substrate-binding protein n=1 Tax=Propionicicella superfundia TaxID=348582 RepID=UPI0004020E1C|nr:ABC transporter substrate-binding protein [Propionicicella superfundia]